VQLNPHLSFDGRCAEAFRFYATCLGGELAAMMTYGESPLAAQTPKEQHGWILHATLQLGLMRLTGADAKGAKPSGFHVLLSCSPKEAKRIFGQLSQDGRVEMELQKTFWTEHFGICVDRFGIPWIISSE
jgi:PhnB protein